VNAVIPCFIGGVAQASEVKSDATSFRAINLRNYFESSSSGVGIIRSSYRVNLKFLGEAHCRIFGLVQGFSFTVSPKCHSYLSIGFNLSLMFAPENLKTGPKMRCFA
jgi:hypothetical protein